MLNEKYHKICPSSKWKETVFFSFPFAKLAEVFQQEAALCNEEAKKKQQRIKRANKRKTLQIILCAQDEVSVLWNIFGMLLLFLLLFAVQLRQDNSRVEAIVLSTW